VAAASTAMQGAIPARTISSAVSPEDLALKENRERTEFVLQGWGTMLGPGAGCGQAMCQMLRPGGDSYDWRKRQRVEVRACHSRRQLSV